MELPDSIRPLPRTRSITEAELLKEFGEPCGRFASIASLTERMEIAALSFRARVSGTDSPHSVSGVPAQWQQLLAYLNRNGITMDHRIQFGEQQPGRPAIPSFALWIDRTRRPTDGFTPKPNAGFGADRDGETALSITIGETLERYFLSTYTLSDLMTGTPADRMGHDGRVLELDTHELFTGSQKRSFPEFVHRPESVYHWVNTESLTDGASVHVPAQFVFWNFDHARAQEPVLIRPTTSGCAGHFTQTEATLGALSELIQRDGFLIHWLGGVAPARIDPAPLEDREIDSLIAYARSFGIELVLLDTSSDLPLPSITCVAIDTGSTNGPVYTVGSAAGFDIRAIIIKSIVEALQVNTLVAALPPYALPHTYTPFMDREIGRMERLRVWKGKDSAERFAFFLSGVTKSAAAIDAYGMTSRSPQEQLDFLVHDLSARDDSYSPLRYVVRDPLLTTLGFHVVRVIVPALVPLYLREYAAPLNMKRLRDVPVALGHIASPSFTPWPHPFP